MTDENKPDGIDDGDDLLSDFNDLFPEESNKDELLNELDSGDDDDLDSLLDGLNTPSEAVEEAEKAAEQSDDEPDDLDSLLDNLDSSLDISGLSDEQPATDESTESDSSDLDSLLDDMEGHVDEIINEESEPEEENIDSMLDELVTESEPVPERDLDIDEDELDLSAVIDDAQDVTASESEPEPEPEPTPEPTEEPSSEEDSTDNMLDDLISGDEEPFANEEPEPAPAAVAATAAVTEEPPKEEPVPEPEPELEEPEAMMAAPSAPEQPMKQPSKLGAIVTYLLLVIALGVAGGAVWMVIEVQSALKISNSKIAKLEKQVKQNRLASDSTYNPMVDQNSSAIRDMDQRLNEVSRLVDGPLSHMGANTSTSGESMVKIEENLQQLEQQLVTLKGEMDQRLAKMKSEMEKRAIVAATTAPAPVVKTPANTPKSTKGWALNLLSLSSSKGADSEVKRLQRGGINASKTPFKTKAGKTWYRVRVSGFSTYAEAKAYAKEMPKLKGISDSWVTKQ